MTAPATDELSATLAGIAGPVESAIAGWLDDPAVPGELREAMRYSCLTGGKRVRPALVLLSAGAVAEESAWRADPLVAAVAVELVHCYSLVHDDLPAMDNDVLRRGRPTCHVQFGQAMAILAGDALLSRAFEVLVSGIATRAISAALVGELALASGPAGMVAGQVADMGLCRVPAGPEGHEFIHRRKTGSLIRSCVRMGGICAGADAAALSALSSFGECVGLAFQVTDDLLDAIGSADELGKTPGKDARTGKQTYATALGPAGAGALAQRLTRQALDSLAPLGQRAGKLARLAELLVRRDR